MVRSAARSQLKEVCGPAKGMLSNVNKNSSCQSSNKEVIVFEKMQTVLAPLPFTVLVRVTWHVLQECSQWHVEHSSDFARVGCQSCHRFYLAYNRSHLQSYTVQGAEVASAAPTYGAHYTYATCSYRQACNCCCRLSNIQVSSIPPHSQGRVQQPSILTESLCLDTNGGSCATTCTAVGSRPSSSWASLRAH